MDDAEFKQVLSAARSDLADRESVAKQAAMGMSCILASGESDVTVRRWKAIQEMAQERLRAARACVEIVERAAGVVVRTQSAECPPAPTDGKLVVGWGVYPGVVADRAPLVFCSMKPVALGVATMIEGCCIRPVVMVFGDGSGFFAGAGVEAADVAALAAAFGLDPTAWGWEAAGSS